MRNPKVSTTTLRYTFTKTSPKGRPLGPKLGSSATAAFRPHATADRSTTAFQRTPDSGCRCGHAKTRRSCHRDRNPPDQCRTTAGTRPASTTSSAPNADPTAEDEQPQQPTRRGESPHEAQPGCDRSHRVVVAIHRTGGMQSTRGRTSLRPLAAGCDPIAPPPILCNSRRCFSVASRQSTPCDDKYDRWITRRSCAYPS